MTNAKILVVEDDHLLQSAFARMIGRAGHQVCVASDALGAVRTAVRERPDLAVLDLGLPAGGGLVVLGRLRTLAATVSIDAIVVTGAILDWATEDKLRELGCEVVLTKPVAGAELLAAINSVLGLEAGAAPSAAVHG